MNPVKKFVDYIINEILGELAEYINREKLYDQFEGTLTEAHSLLMKLKEEENYPFNMFVAGFSYFIFRIPSVNSKSYSNSFTGPAFSREIKQGLEKLFAIFGSSIFCEINYHVMNEAINTQLIKYFFIEDIHKLIISNENYRVIIMSQSTGPIYCSCCKSHHVCDCFTRYSYKKCVMIEASRLVTSFESLDNENKK